MYENTQRKTTIVLMMDGGKRSVLYVRFRTEESSRATDSSAWRAPKAVKEVSALKIRVDNDDKGIVTLRGNARSNAEADRVVTVARNYERRDCGQERNQGSSQ